MLCRKEVAKGNFVKKGGNWGCEAADIKNKPVVLARNGHENVDVSTTIICIGQYCHFAKSSRAGGTSCNIQVFRFLSL